MFFFVYICTSQTNNDNGNPYSNRLSHIYSHLRRALVMRSGTLLNHFLTFLNRWKMLRLYIFTTMTTTVAVLKPLDSVGFLPLLLVAFGIGLFYYVKKKKLWTD